MNHFMKINTFSALLWLLLFISNGSIALALSVADVAPNGFVFEMPTDLSRESALAALDDARLTVNGMMQLNLSVAFVSDALAEADSTFESGNYAAVFRLSQLIVYIHNNNVDFLDSITLLEEKETDARNNGVNTDSTRVFLDNAREAFSYERFDEAHELLGKADAQLKEAEQDYRRVALIERLRKNILLRYWWQMLLLIAVLTAFSFPAVKIARRKLLERRVRRLREELQHAQELIKKMQQQCFVEKKITQATYKMRVAQYEDKIAEIKHTLPVLEGMLDADQEKNRNEVLNI
ncbi:hypothetical protein HY497_01445 [Candidatus Woesearchaeota archaeon]|nr:hypothetical protein [Candidatus Woesearchaeota archaeon]